jgi:D-aminopeptidase
MICFEFKCGIGTSSRVVAIDGSAYTVGVLVQANFGLRRQLRIAGVPVGREFPGDLVWSRADTPATLRGSIIAVVATDAPLLPGQLQRLARRVSLGIARTGGTASNGSGDIFLAFSTANPGAGRPGARIESLNNELLDDLFEACVQAAEESIVNALVAGRTMTGDLGHRAVGIDREKLRGLLADHDRLAD